MTACQTLQNIDSLVSSVIHVLRTDLLIDAVCRFFFYLKICKSSSIPGVSSDTSEPRARIPGFRTHDSDKYLRLVLFSSLSLFQSMPHCSKFTSGSVFENWVSRPHGFCPGPGTRWVWYQSFLHLWVHCAFYWWQVWEKSKALRDMHHICGDRFNYHYIILLYYSYWQRA